VAKKGSLRTAHLVVAVLVVLLVNAQLSWWIIFFLRENRHQLDLKRANLELEAKSAAREMAAELDRARMILELYLARNPELPLKSPAPFVSLDRTATTDDCGGWESEGGKPILEVSSEGGCCRATLSSKWIEKIRAQVAPLVIRTEAKHSMAPRIPCPAPFGDELITPAEQAWDEILQTYRGRILMMVSEGTFFALMLFVLVALLWRTLRREVALEMEHRNFLSAVTHELKSPLAAMRLSLETVLRGRADSGASVRFLENALQDAERLQDLVEKVLEVTRFTRKGGGLNRQDQCLSELIEETVERFSRRTTAAGANLHANITRDIWAEVDGEALSIVISNLLENALKYGGTLPRIDISLGLDGEDALLDVADNGRGITDDDVPLVFERFWRSGDEMTRTTQGTGLGLFLVRQIVLAHNGSVEVFSTGPSGTVFRVRIPRARLEEE